MTTMFYNRLIHHLKGAPLTLQVQSDDTDAGMQIMLKVTLSPKIGKNQDVHTQVNKWESLINILGRDYQEKVSGMMKVGLLFHMMPDDLKDTIPPTCDRLVKEEGRQSRGREGWLRDANAMDVGC